MSTPRVTAIIPARFGSTRFPGKPLALLSGRPMVLHVMERASRAASVSDVLVATDDERIADVVREAGGTAVMTPSSMQTGTDRIALVAQSLRETEIVVNVQGDEPLIPPAMIDEAAAPLLQDGSVPMATLAKVIERGEDLDSPDVVKVVIDINGRALYFSRRPIPFVRDSPDRHASTHLRHIGLYAYRREFLLRLAAMPRTPLEVAEELEQLRVLEHGYPIRVVVTHYESASVDTPADLTRVQTILEHQ